MFHWLTALIFEVRVSELLLSELGTCMELYAHFAEQYSMHHRDKTGQY
jgi:hypothetical protein